MPKPKSKVKKVYLAASCLAFMLLLCPKNVHAAVINAQPSTSCDMFGNCQTSVNLSTFLNTNQINNLKAKNLSAYLPKLDLNITSFSYYYNGNTLIFSGHINSNTYWTVDLQNGYSIDPWWNTSFNHKILVSNASAILAYNYTYCRNYTYKTDMASDFSDFRAVNASENENYSSWIMTSSASAWAEICTLIPGNQTSFYYYYGNTTPVSAVDMGKQTCNLIYDHFNDASLNATLWTCDVQGGAGRCTETGDGVTVRGTGANWADLCSKANYGNNTQVYIRANDSSASNTVSVGFKTGLYMGGATNLAVFRWNYPTTTAINGYNELSGSGSGVSFGNLQGYQIYSIRKNGTATNNQYAVNFSAYSLRTSYVVPNNTHVCFTNLNAENLTVDFVCAMNYTQSEANWSEGNPINQTFQAGTNLYLQGNESNVTITNATLLNITATSNITGLNVSLYQNGTLLNTSATLVSNYATLAPGLYNITAETTGNATHLGSNVSYWANVSAYYTPAQMMNMIVCFKSAPYCVDLDTLKIQKENDNSWLNGL